MNSVNKRDEILEKNRTDFQNNLKKLFDIGACKCRFFQTCSCKIAMKVPKEEQVLLLDQRGKRKMIISGVDPKITQRNLKKLLENRPQVTSASNLQNQHLSVPWMKFQMKKLTLFISSSEISSKQKNLLLFSYFHGNFAPASLGKPTLARSNIK